MSTTWHRLKVVTAHYVPRVTKNRFLHFGKYTFKQLFSNIHKFLEIKPKELALYYEK